MQLHEWHISFVFELALKDSSVQVDGIASG